MVRNRTQLVRLASICVCEALLHIFIIKLVVISSRGSRNLEGGGNMSALSYFIANAHNEL